MRVRKKTAVAACLLECSKDRGGFFSTFERGPFAQSHGPARRITPAKSSGGGRRNQSFPRRTRSSGTPCGLCTARTISMKAGARRHSTVRLAVRHRHGSEKSAQDACARGRGCDRGEIQRAAGARDVKLGQRPTGLRRRTLATATTSRSNPRSSGGAQDGTASVGDTTASRISAWPDPCQVGRQSGQTGRGLLSLRRHQHFSVKPARTRSCLSLDRGGKKKKKISPSPLLIRVARGQTRAMVIAPLLFDPLAYQCETSMN